MKPKKYHIDQNLVVGRIALCGRYEMPNTWNLSGLKTMLDSKLYRDRVSKARWCKTCKELFNANHAGETKLSIK